MPAISSSSCRIARSNRFGQLAFALLLLLSIILADHPDHASAVTRQVNRIAVGTNNEGLGTTLSISGGTLVAGAPSGFGHGQLTGLARVFVESSAGWSEQSTLFAPDGAYSDRFGAAVAIDGDTVAVGAPAHSGDGGAWAAGVVYVFARTNGVWNLQATLIPNDRVLGGYDDMFGRALALSGNTLLIGADKIGNGAAYVFTRAGTTWSQQAKLRATDGSLYADFGASIAISQGTVLIGAPGARAAYVFEQGAGGWVERQKLVSGTAPVDSQRGFGAAVAIDLDTLVVGATRDNSSSPAAAAYIFTRTNASWALRATLDATEDPESLSFGAAVSIDGNTVAVGAPYRHLDPDVPEWIGGAGAAHVYQGSGATWAEIALLSGNQTQSIGMFGAAVLVSGDTLIVGAPRSAGPNGSDDGHIYTARASALTRAAADRATTLEDTPTTLHPLANDSVGPNGSLSPAAIDLALLRRPRHGVANVDVASGTLVYTPTKDFNGDDSFTYVGGWGLPASITVTVTPFPDPPVFTSQPPTAATERIPYTYRVTTADPDPGDKLALSATALPGWLALDDHGDGTAVLTGTAALADVGVYPISLSVRDSAGLSATQVFTIGVKAFLPATPTNLSAAVASRSQVRLNWTDTSTDESRFAIERSEAGGAWAEMNSVAQNTTTFTDTNRTCNTRYDYRVLALNGNGSSPPSNVASATIADCTLDAPTDLFATVETTHSLLLRWIDRSDNESGFSIERSSDGVTWQPLGQTPANIWYSLQDGMACEPASFYRVRAFNPGGASGYSNTIHTSACPPAAPSNLSATPAAQNSLELTWADNSDNEIGFKIEVSRDGKAQWRRLAVTQANVTSYPIDGLTCGTTYFFRVYAFNGSGSSQNDSASGATASCTVIYVDAGAAGSGDGSSWANAYTDLQQALAGAAARPNPANVQLWVAAGTYRPTLGTDRKATFQLVNGAALYGGFAVGETALEQRDWRAHPTILSGDIGVPGDPSDNSYHVVSSANVSANTLLDGFTITGGNANGAWLEGTSAGGGMYNATSSPTVRNAIFIANSAGTGGGMANVGSGTIYVNGCYPMLDHVLFLGNYASDGGGGMANAYGGRPTLVDVVFSGNRASTGGAMNNYWQSNTTLINTTFSGNQATQWGGAISDSANSPPTIRNAIFWGNNRNQGGDVGQIFDTGGNSTPIVSDSLLQSSMGSGPGVGGERNNVADPLFVDADGADNIAGTLDDDLRLQSESPAVDAGNNEVVPAATTTDLAGAPRFADHRNKADTGVGIAPIVDIGAYEYQPPPAPHAAPSNLLAVATSRVGIALTWTDMSDDEQGFKIERQTGAGAWIEIARLPAGATSYADAPLPCGITFNYRVLAFNPGGDTAPSAAATATTDACIPRVIYVNQRAAGANDGSSWANAYTDLQSALAITTIHDDQIWVAAGTYNASSTGNQAATFRLISGVAIYGGFGGSETSLNQRDPAAHPTILSGDLGNDDPPGAPTYASVQSAMADNSYHVVTADGVDAATVLDGLTIAGGNSYADPQSLLGGGLLNRNGAPTIRNVIFRNNAGGQGGGIANIDGAPTFHNVVFSQNHAADGASMYNQGSSLTLDGVMFRENTTSFGYCAGIFNQSSHLSLRNVAFILNDSYWGAGGIENHDSDGTLEDVTFESNQGDIGGMLNASSSPTLRRITFKDNRARNTWGGGGMYNQNSSPVLTDVVFVGNQSNYGGGGMYNMRSNPTLVNVVFAGNQAPLDNTIAGGGGGMLNYASSPTLVNVTFSGNSASSPARPFGGAIANYGQSAPTLINVTMTGNTAQLGGAIYNTDNSRPVLRNSILWGDTAPDATEIFDGDTSVTDARFSIVAGGWAGTGNRDTDPRFVEPGGPDTITGTLDDNLRLSAGSPALDAGDTNALPNDITDVDGDGDLAERLPLDLDRNPRVVDDSAADTGVGSPPIVDLGAYERQSAPPGATPLLTINYMTGRPGSVFLVTGSGFSPTTRLRVTVSGLTIGELSSDANGAFTVAIETQTGAISGGYQIVVTPATSAVALQSPSVAYVLDQAAPLRAKQASVFDLIVPLAAHPTARLTVFIPIARR